MQRNLIYPMIVYPVTQKTDFTYQPLTLAELAAMPFPEQTWVVQDLLPQGSLTLFSGREKSGKSLLMADLGACVSAGEPILGHDVTLGPVMLVPAEENLRDIQSRLTRRLQGATDIPLQILPVNQREEDRLDLANPACITALREALITHQPSLLILDPLRELHDLAENDADAMGPLRNLAHELNVAVVLTHHMSKAGTSRGSTAILAACDQGWEFQLTEGSETSATDLSGTLSVKGRYGPRQHLGIRMGEALRWQCAVQALPQNPSALSRIMTYLRWMGEPLVARKIAGALGCDLRTVQNVLSEASKPGGAISKVGAGLKNDPYRYIVDDEAIAS